MQLASRHPAVQQLLRLIETTELRGLRGVDGDMREVNFVSHRTLDDYFDRVDVLENLLRAHFPDGDRLVERIDVGQIKRSYARIFCLLIVIGKGEFIIHFTEYGISDRHLPLSRHKPDGFPTDPADSRFFETFLQRQWQFCVPELKVMNGRRFDPSEWILPIRMVKRLGEGVSADIYQVEVHGYYDPHETDCNDQSNTSYRSSGQRRPKTLVLKSYRNVPHAERYWNNEWQALKRLHGNGTCENIVGFHGSFVLGGVFHILLEYADMGTLEDYLTTIPPPCSSEDINTFYKSLLRVVYGLLRIHNSPAPDILKNREGGPEIFQGWHQDIKPKNILIKRRPGGSVYEFECKLADLGLSHFKRSLSGQEDSTDTAAYGTRTYGAPECFRLGSSIENENLTVKRDVDIWSLGCVLSVVCTWVVYNWTYVEEYSKRRRIEVKKTGRFTEEDDCFHNGKDELLNCVDQNHNELAKDVRARDYITKKVLKMIKEDMLRPSQISDARRKARYLCHEVEKMIREAEAELLKNTRGSQSFEITHPDNGLGPLSESALEPPEPPGTARRSNYNPWHPPLLSSEMILRRPVVHGASPISNGQPYLDPQGQMSHEHSICRQANLVEDEIADSFEPTISGTIRPSTLPHRPSNPYSHRKPSALALSRGPAEDSIYNPLIDFTGGTSARRSGYRITSLENQYLPVPGSSPTTPERNLNVPREDPRMQPYSAQESTLQGLQHQKSLPVWHVEDALRWKRVQKDPKNYERIKIPDDNGDLEKLKGRDHVFVIDNTSSMIPHWSDARELLGLLFYLVKRADPDGVDLHFTSPAKHYYRIKTTTDVLELFDQNKPRAQGYCDMSFELSSIVSEYQRTLSNRHAPRSIFGKIRSQETRRLSVYTFTDAVWQPRCDVAPVIRSLVKTLNEENLLKQQAGIQFIRFGDSQEGTKRLDDLDNLVSSNYVDM
ncbi:MAG: hypothetical protein Q9195_004010 [Heterodermia aff. obscurata]